MPEVRDVALTLGMNLQQTQTLIMTPQLKQALAVLQMPVPVLCAYLDQELQANPALEMVEEAVLEQEPDSAPEPEADTAPEAQEAGLDPLEIADWLEGEAPVPRVTRRDNGLHGLPDWEAASPGPTLKEYLENQVAVSGWSKRDKAGVGYLIGNLKDSGYLAAPLEELAWDLGATAEEAQRLLALLQSLEPTGVGARDLRECLLLQLQAKGEEGALVWRLVAAHLEDLAAGRWSLLARRLGVSQSDLAQARERLRSLDPKPGRSFSSGPDVRYVVPDAYVERVAGEYVVVLNDVAMPTLGLSQAYRSALHQADEPARRYIEERLQAGLWLLRALEQRRQTLFRVVEAVARRQRRYLQEGAEALVPLTLKVIGAELSLHESTVSRAVAGKFVQTPRGLKPLRYFFGSGVAGPGGEGISATGVKRRLEQFIRREDVRRPLSDEALCRRLQGEGIDISRRTVAKYREELGIPSSTQRRRLT